MSEMNHHSPESEDGSSQGRVTISFNGQSLHLERGVPLIESLKGLGKEELQGFCYSPMLKVSQPCELCLVYDEKNQKVVKSCELVPEGGDAFSTESSELKETIHDRKAKVLNGHTYHCSQCSHLALCDLRKNESAGVPLVPSDSEEGKEETFTHDVLLNNRECIDCGLCLDFENQVASQPSLQRVGDKVEVKAKPDHNLSANLIDLCPTGCFQPKKNVPVNGFQEGPVVSSFCRGCDRLCETELSYEKSSGTFLGLRHKLPQYATYWLCDESLRTLGSWGRLLLSSPLFWSSETQKWQEGELPSLHEQFHFVLPENLPDIFWVTLNEYFALKKDWTFEIFIHSSRPEEKGILRKRRGFKQSLAESFCERFASQKVDSRGGKVLAILPEVPWGKQEWLNLIEKFKGREASLFTPYFLEELRAYFPHQFPVPPYESLVWSAHNYMNESRHSRGLVASEPRSLRFFREGGVL